MEIEINVKATTEKQVYKRISMQITEAEYEFARNKGDILEMTVDRLLTLMRKELEKEDANPYGNKM